MSDFTYAHNVKSRWGNLIMISTGRVNKAQRCISYWHKALKKRWRLLDIFETLESLLVGVHGSEMVLHHVRTVQEGCVAQPHPSPLCRLHCGNTGQNSASTDSKLRINPPTSLEEEDFSLTVERFRTGKKSIHETGLVNYDLERRTPSTERVRP